MQNLYRSESFRHFFGESSQIGCSQNDHSSSFDSPPATDEVIAGQASQSRIALALSDVFSRIRNLTISRNAPADPESCSGSTLMLEPQKNATSRKATFIPSKPRSGGVWGGAGANSSRNAFGSTSSLTGNTADTKIHKASKKNRWKNRSSLTSSISKDCSAKGGGHFNLNAIGDAEVNNPCLVWN